MGNVKSSLEWMQTYTGLKFVIEDPAPESIEICDIAQALSQIPRFNGHTKGFYSVAEHSLYMSYLIRPAKASLMLQALLHDAEEAYIGDIIQPLKSIFKEYYPIAARIRRAIYKKCGVSYPNVKIKMKIKELETRLILTERDQLLAPPPEKWNLDFMEEVKPLRMKIKCLKPDEACHEFAWRFMVLENNLRLGIK